MKKKIKFRQNKNSGEQTKMKIHPKDEKKELKLKTINFKKIEKNKNKQKSGKIRS